MKIMNVGFRKNLTNKTQYKNIFVLKNFNKKFK